MQIRIIATSHHKTGQALYQYVFMSNCWKCGRNTSRGDGCDGDNCCSCSSCCYDGCEMKVVVVQNGGRGSGTGTGSIVMALLVIVTVVVVVEVIHNNNGRTVW